ncbi:MAG TPA: hypothetical protein VIO60_08675 [Rectinemataceae bacterium]
MSISSPYALAHGAAWVLPDGRVIKIPGFHSSWIASHPSIAPGASNTAEFVARTGWVSAVLHEGGWLEVIIRSLDDQRQKDCLWNMVQANSHLIRKLVLMILGREGVLEIPEPGALSRDEFEARADAMPRD